MRNAYDRSTQADERRRYVDSALGSLAIENLEVRADARAYMEQYVAGELTVDEMTAAILALRW